jgi:hypothetical protein
MSVGENMYDEKEEDDNNDPKLLGDSNVHDEVDPGEHA